MRWLAVQRVGVVLVVVCVYIPLVFGQVASSPDDPAEFFEVRIRPILADNCFACHTSSNLGGLRLDSRESILKGGNSGPAIKPGNAAESLLIQAVSHTHERFKMPQGGKLTEGQIAHLKTWVDSGAPWPKPEPGTHPTPPREYVIAPEQRQFWAFQPVRRPAVPTVSDESWPTNKIDRFILSKLEEKNLEPANPAQKLVLLRRATFDLIGLPPTPEEVDAFLTDSSPEAFAKVVDQLLASPHYGERWGRYWLDLARYADGKLGASKDTPYLNAFRYRDWVIRAFNNDMPYDTFVKAQIAADLLPEENREKLLAGLGFQALGTGPHDQVDVTTRAFLGLTVACARCHDHKYDPIPTKDYYSLLGIFKSSEYQETPLVPSAVVDSYETLKKKIDAQREAIDDFIVKHSIELGRILATKTSRYMVAAWKVMSDTKGNLGSVAQQDNLDEEILERWIHYLAEPTKDYSYLKDWDKLLASGAGRATLVEVREIADQFQEVVFRIFAEKVAIDDRNYIALGGAEGAKDEKIRQFTNLESLEIEKYYLWRDLASEPYMKNGIEFNGGIYYYGIPSTLTRGFEIRGGELPPLKPIRRFLSGEWKDYLERMRAELAALKEALPPKYPFLHTIRDGPQPANARVAIRGDAQNLGEEVGRHFLRVLCEGEPKPFIDGSGRLELAEAIASPNNPLTARVMVNRIWELHFGEGLVRSPSNFGHLGERPTHRELLDYLASGFIETGWSIKVLHRKIMLSTAYALSTENSEHNFALDPDNRFLWRANLRQRLDAEALRDSLLAVSGELDPAVGGLAVPLESDNRRRTVYGYISRTELDAMLGLFDFPNPNSTSEHRGVTVGPLQRLYFLNNDFVMNRAKAVADRLNGGSDLDDTAKINKAYRLLFGRSAKKSEIELGLEFLTESNGAWSQYAQVLLSSSEFSAVK